MGHLLFPGKRFGFAWFPWEVVGGRDMNHPGCIYQAAGGIFSNFVRKKCLESVNLVYCILTVAVLRMSEQIR